MYYEEMRVYSRAKQTKKIYIFTIIHRRYIFNLFVLIDVTVELFVLQTKLICLGKYNDLFGVSLANDIGGGQEQDEAANFLFASPDNNLQQ
jgi:hypothetical protein